MSHPPTRPISTSSPGARLSPLPNFIFMSRWLQLPLYLGLILAQCVYVYHFWLELFHLISAALGNQGALSELVSGIGYEIKPEAGSGQKLTETVIMLAVLGLIDVVMISNLLIMVIVGGYETFVSRMGLEGHRDEPEWLSHVNASVLKVKLGTAIIGISSIHLLKTFINAEATPPHVLMWQTIIHVAFLASAIAIAYTDRLLNLSSAGAHRSHPPEDGV
ncbi:MAG: TIGR00645 family protein [Caldimonas sp.]